MHNTKNTEILIVGAGLMGMSAALCFQHQPVAIEILENDLSFHAAQTDTRPISLSYGSHCMLKKLGVWDPLADHACPINTVHISEQGRFGSTRINAAEQKVPALGFIVPLNQLQFVLYQKVQSLSNVTLTPIQHIDQITTGDQGVLLQLENNIQKTAELLIAADGTQSTCRKLLHIATRTENHNDSAWIFQLQLSSPLHFTAYERFTKKGALAILPLQDPLIARLVWSMKTAVEKEIIAWDEKTLLSFLQTVFANRVSITNIKKTAQFPLQTVLAETQVIDGAVIIGNAAHTIYPVAAQGFNLGLADLSVLQTVLIDAIEKNEPLGSKRVLTRYHQQVTPHQEAIINLTNRLMPLFDIQLPSAGCLRGIGLLGMDLIYPLKNKLAKRAMGILDS